MTLLLWGFCGLLNSKTKNITTNGPKRTYTKIFMSGTPSSDSTCFSCSSVALFLNPGCLVPEDD